MCLLLHIIKNTPISNLCDNIVLMLQAEDKGILFMPVPGLKRYEGKQLYNFGQSTMFIDRGVVFVMKGSQWTPVSLDDLLRLA